MAGEAEQGVGGIEGTGEEDSEGGDSEVGIATDCEAGEARLVGRQDPMVRRGLDSIEAQRRAADWILAPAMRRFGGFMLEVNSAGMCS